LRFRRKKARSLIGASRLQPGALPRTASKVGSIRSVIVHYLCIAMHGPSALGRFVSIFAGTSYARGRARVRGYTDEHHGTKTPQANAHVRGRVRAYSPIIAAGVPDADLNIFAHCDLSGRQD
jgi:hypothetical protein